ncbi:MAG: AAA family ATPase [Pseudomonadota bacterium]
MAVAPLPTVRACDLDADPPEARWLISQVWVRQGVGVVGGHPKLGKSWMGLDMAISVASGTPCLGRFPVERPGPAVVFLAEDGLGAVRSRIDAICTHRRLDLHRLPLHVITAPVLRLDTAEHQAALHATIEKLQPRLLVLDPLVRLHRLDENSSSDMSGLLGFLRELQRKWGVAIALVHHASKRARARPGQALRGSSDLHAFVDSLAYLARQNDELMLHLEHRSAPTPEPVPVRLVHGPGGKSTHLQVIGGDEQLELPVPLEARVMEVLDGADEPMMRKDLRERLRVNNQRLGKALERLESDGETRRTDQGWLRRLPKLEPHLAPAR